MKRYDPMGQGWCDLNWTLWQPLNREALQRTAPTLPGVYRIRRASEASRFVYIGQTGRTLRERLLSLVRGVHGDRCPYNDPHTAAPYLWLIQELDGAKLEFSCAPTIGDTALLRGTEDLLLWRHRVEFGRSTEANYGRFYPGYMRPTNRWVKRGGAQMPGRTAARYSDDHSQPSFASSEPALHGAGGILDAEWWEKTPLALASTLPSQSAVYCIFEAGIKHPVYIGETSSLRARAVDHVRAHQQLREPWLAYRVLPTDTPKHVLRELESDLLGWHFSTHRSAPALQYRVLPLEPRD